MAKAYVRRAGDVAELVISAPPLSLFDGHLAADLASALDEVTALTRGGRRAAPGRRRDAAAGGPGRPGPGCRLVMTGDS